MKVFVKKFVSLAFSQKWRIKKKKNSIVAIEMPKLEEFFFKKKNATTTLLDE